MKFEKRKLCDLPSCYAASFVEIGGKPELLLAPDAYGPCYGFDADSLERETVWAEPGGTMSMVRIPGKEGEFLAVQGFNPGFAAENAKVVHVRRVDGVWKVDFLFTLPFIHRFDILERGGVRYLVCCTVCTSKRFEQDWSSPGFIYAAELPDDLSQPIPLFAVAEGMTRNHGYCRVEEDGYSRALTSCDQGVFEIFPPPRKGDAWAVRRILDRPVSDIALCDIDGDGVMELAAIEPFHGADFTVYRQTAEGFVPLYRYPAKTAFCHVVWGGKLRGEPVFIGGCREEGRELFVLRWKEGVIVAETIESGGGPANIAVIPGKERDLVLVANRSKGEGALYTVRNG